MLINSHTHLNSKTLDDDILYLCSTSFQDIEKVSMYSDPKKEIIKFVGVHPWFIKNNLNFLNIDLKNFLEKIIDTLTRFNFNVGEIGIDKSYKILEETSLDIQMEVFEIQAAFAVKNKKVMNIHLQKSYNEFFEIQKRLKIFTPIIFHSFSSNSTVLKKLLSFNSYFALNGILLAKKDSKTLETLKAIPLENLFIETDAKDLKILELYNIVSQVLNISEIELTERLLKNHKNIFGELSDKFL